MTSPNDAILEAITAAVGQVLLDTGREPRPVEPAMLLGTDLGLDSLDLAQTVVLLERAVGFDPFRSAVAGSDRPPIRTVADLAAAYRRAVEPGG